MNSFLLHSFDLQSVKFLIENLTKIHHNRFVDLLPQMGTENLNQGNLQCRDFAVHENASQIKLDLETNVNVGSVDGWRPP